MKTTKIVKIITLLTITFFIAQIFNSNISAKNTSLNFENEVENWAVLICGGVKNDTHGLDKVQRNTTIKAYNTYKKLGYDDEHIYFLQLKNPSNENEDLPEGVDGFSNKSNAKFSITNWLSHNSDGNDNCFILLIDHGNFHFNTGGGLFWFYDNLSDKEEYLSSIELSDWLDKINYSVCTIFIDACFSGGFIKHISAENRIVITSTKLTKGVASSTLDFSSFFFDKLEENASYGKAWEYAEKNHLQIKIKDLPQEASLLLKIVAKILILRQSPQIDDNGDGRGSGNRFITDKLPIRKDGFLALQTYPS